MIMNRGLVFAGGVGVGAAMMYLLDPNRGKRRRALVRDQLAHLAKRTPEIVDTTARDLKNRARGMVAEMRSQDPNRGKRRRALVRDQLAHLAKRTPEIVDTTARDLKNRARGMVAEMRS